MKTKHHLILSAPVTQSGAQKLNNPTRARWFAPAFGGFLFISVFALPAPPVEAQCQQWNVGHAWRFKQGPTNVDLDLDQNGTVITGKANHKIYVKEFEGDANVRGTVDGTVKGDSFAVHIYWTNHTVGVYDGTIQPSGKIEGTGYEQSSPSVKVNWYSLGVMKCADAAPAAPPPIKSSGKAKPAPLPMNSYKAGDPNRPKGFINGLQLATPTPRPSRTGPTPSTEADESSSSETEDQHGKHKKNKNKNKKKHQHDDDDQNQGND